MTAEVIFREMCIRDRATVMEEGGDRRTGRTARPAGYAIGGKTGTAETIPRKNGEYVVSFMGYAPADDPQIAIYVVVDRVNASPQDDAKFATGIVRNVDVYKRQGLCSAGRRCDPVPLQRVILRSAIDRLRDCLQAE